MPLAVGVVAQSCMLSEAHPRWCQLQWPTSWSSEHITSKEMVPILIAALILGCCLSHKQLVVYSDNMATVSTLAAGSARGSTLAHLSLFFISAKWSFEVTATHVTGRANIAADALPRNDLAFLHPLPQLAVNPLLFLILSRSGYSTRTHLGHQLLGCHSSRTLWPRFSTIISSNIRVWETAISKILQSSQPDTSACN